MYVKLNNERAAKRLIHWQSIAISACEQSGRAFVPTVLEPKPLSKWLAENPYGNQCRIQLNPIGAKRIAEIKKPNSVIVLLIGAEGGLSEREISLSIEQGFAPWCLGQRVLRTETAPVAVLSVLQWLWGDFS